MLIKYLRILFKKLKVLKYCFLINLKLNLRMNNGYMTDINSLNLHSHIILKILNALDQDLWRKTLS